MQIKLKITRKISVKAVLGVALSAACLTACVDKSDTIPGGQPAEIIPSATFSQGGIEAQSNTFKSSAPQSRVPVDGTTSLTLFFARADQSAQNTYGSYGTAHISATRTSGNGAIPLTFSPKQFYLADGGLKTKLTGWHPSATTFSAGAVSWTFDGTQDIMTAPVQEGTKTAPMPGFIFSHRLAQLQFLPYADNQRITQSWGKITKIEILAQPDAATYSLTDDTSGAVTFTGNSTFSAGIAADGTAIASSKNDAVMAGNAVMIAPQASDDYVLTLSVTTEKQGVKTAAITRKLEAGVPYKIYLRFVQLEMIITPEITIGDWIPGYSSNIQTDPVTEPGIDIGDWTTGEDWQVDY